MKISKRNVEFVTRNGNQVCVNKSSVKFIALKKCPGEQKETHSYLEFCFEAKLFLTSELYENKAAQKFFDEFCSDKK